MTHILYFLLTILLFSGCQSGENRTKAWREWMHPNGKVKVLSTTAMINDLAKRVGGEYVDTLTLIEGNLDPHSYQLVKGDDEKIGFADLVFYNGLGLEHGASLQNLLEKSPKAVPLGNLIQDKEPERILSINSQVDPHIWMDMSLFSEALPYIVKELSKKDPQHQQEYRRNGERAKAELMDLHEQVKRKIQSIPKEKRYLVTSHDAFNYFSLAYLAEPDELADQKWMIRFQAPEGLAPDSQLSSLDLKLIVDHLAKYKIHTIFPESNVSQDSIRKIVDAAKEQGVEVNIAEDPLYGDAMGSAAEGGDTYPRMILHNANVIQRYLIGAKL